MVASNHTSRFLRVLFVAALLVAAIVHPGSARAQSIAPTEGGLSSALEGEAGGTPGKWMFSLGAGPGIVPDYEGSDEYKPVPILFARAQRDQIYVTLEANTLRANLLPEPVFQIGPLVRYRPERDNVENDAVDHLKKVDPALELGGFVGFQNAGWHGRFEITQDVADAYNGLLLGVKGGYRSILSPKWTLNTTMFTSWASNDYMDTYFGISGADAARSGLKPFNADAGFKDVGFSLAAHYGGIKGWGVTGIAAYKRMLGDAADSPVVHDVGNPNQFFAGALLTYGF